MTSQVNEFAINLPMTSVGTVGASSIPAIDCTPAPLPPEVDNKCDHINVYVDGCPQVNQVPDTSLISMDLVLNVSVTNPVTGTCSTYKVVKRLSMDKCKLALDAETLTPFQVVEGEGEPEDATLVEAEMKEFYYKREVMRKAGIQESAGTKKFKVLFRFDDVEGNKKWDAAHPEAAGAKHSASATVVIDHVKDKAHARHVWTLRHGNHAKYPNAKIVRVTEVV